MSRYYRMQVKILGVAKENKNALVDAYMKHWVIDNEDYFEKNTELDLEGEGSLCGGEGEEEFAARMSDELLNVTKDISIEIYCTYLEDLPCQVYTFGKESNEHTDRQSNEG